MRKLTNLFYVLGICLIASSFIRCSDDDDDYKKSTDSQILEMTFDNPVVIGQPVIDGTNITFQVAAGTASEDLKELVPTIKISDKAIIDPASGSKVDFSAGTVEFTVTAEDNITKTVYKVSYQKVGKYDFEEWVVENPAATSESLYYYAPAGGWSSSNGGAAFAKGFGQIDRFVVTKSENAHSGENAAKIETLGTKGNMSLFPKILSGSLYVGQFIIDLKNTLNSTKFGIPYSQKPITVKGHYKYSPGPEFHRCPDPTKYNVTVIEENTKDECSINAILYEIENDDDTYITGVDTYTDKRLVAVAKLEDGTAKADYTPFSITMNYLKPYDPAKKYRFAIICSSSKYGDTFSGAPESVLMVDDIEVISE